MNAEPEKTTSLKQLQNLLQLSPHVRRARDDAHESSPYLPNRNDRLPDQPVKPSPVTQDIRDERPRREAMEQRRTSARHQSTPSSYRRISLRPSELAYSTPDAGNRTQSPYAAGTQRLHQAEGTESEVSTTAPSTVWDELTELKSRMKKLEHSTNYSRANGSSRETQERPDTGNTHTTASTSWQSSHGDLLSNAITRITSQDLLESHSLLHSALRKAKGTVSSDVYRALESSASDALNLYALSRAVNINDPHNDAHSTANGQSSSSKRIMMKAESMCRSLTELCIALCDNTTRSPHEVRPSFRPSSRNHMSTNGHNSPLSYLEERRRLSERVERLTSRSPSRHRDPYDLCTATTAQPRRLNSRTYSIIEGSNSTSTARPTLSRAATTHTQAQSQYAMTESSSLESSPDRDPTLRAPSRARTMTDVTAGRSRAMTHSPRDLRISRDYTSRHPLPGTMPSTPSAAQAVPSTNQSTASSFSRRDAERDRPRRSSTSSLRAPPSTGIGLAERLEAKRQQRVAAASQLRGEGVG